MLVRNMTRINLHHHDRLAENSSEFTSDAIAELRRTSGLTWDQLGRLFGVSRRSVHFWASGKPMNAANEQHLLQVLDVVRRADRGDARSNRAVLFEVSENGTPFDLLASKRFDEAGALLGRGPGRRRLTLRPLDAKAAAERAPLPPEALIDAMNDRIHRDVGRVRLARTVRNVPRESNDTDLAEGVPSRLAPARRMTVDTALRGMLRRPASDTDTG